MVKLKLALNLDSTKRAAFLYVMSKKKENKCVFFNK